MVKREVGKYWVECPQQNDQCPSFPDFACFALRLVHPPPTTLLLTAFIKYQCLSPCSHCPPAQASVMHLQGWLWVFAAHHPTLIFFWESMPPAFLVHVVLQDLTQPQTPGLARLNAWLLRTQCLVKGWPCDPLEPMRQIPWVFSETSGIDRHSY